MPNLFTAKLGYYQILYSDSNQFQNNVVFYRYNIWWFCMIFEWSIIINAEMYRTINATGIFSFEFIEFLMQ